LRVLQEDLQVKRVEASQEKTKTKSKSKWSLVLVYFELIELRIRSVGFRF
jgi:hypothetical protein